MRFFLNFLFYQVNRTAFYFHVCLCQILPQNTRTEKLYAAGHQDDAHQRRPAGHRISEDQLPHDDKYDHQKGNDAEQHAQVQLVQAELYAHRHQDGGQDQDAGDRIHQAAHQEQQRHQDRQIHPLVGDLSLIHI